MSKLISIGKIIDLTWDHYVTHFKVLMKISLWIFVVALVSIIFTIINPVDFEQNINIQEAFNASEVWWNIAQAVIAFGVSVVIGSWIFTATLLVADQQKAKKSVDLAATSKRSWRLLIPVMLTSFFKAVAVVATLLLLVPGTVLLFYNTAGPQIPWLSALGILLTFIGVVTAFILAVYLGTSLHLSEWNLLFHRLKDRGFTKGVVFALHDSWATLKETRMLIKGRFWATFMKIVVPKIVFAIPVIFINIVLVLFVTLIIPSLVNLSPEAFVKTTNILDTLISTGVTALTTPLFFIADYYLYDSLKKTR